MSSVNKNLLCSRALTELGVLHSHLVRLLGYDEELLKSFLVSPLLWSVCGCLCGDVYGGCAGVGVGEVGMVYMGCVYVVWGCGGHVVSVEVCVVSVRVLGD